MMAFWTSYLDIFDFRYMTHDFLTLPVSWCDLSDYL
jgi:hypothetical protein